MDSDRLEAGRRAIQQGLFGPTDEEPERLPERIGKFAIVDKLGEGGMGIVYKALDPDLGRALALKVLRTENPEDIERLHREARIAARLRHPGIVAVHDVGTANGQPYIVMDLVEGTSLEGADLAPRRALEIVRDAAAALRHAHLQGIVHRDLKPGNILLDGAGRVFVTDFGMAKTTDAASSISTAGIIMGTPAYMSPEQAGGRAAQADARSDVWGLGATLYHLLAGHPPFQGETSLDVVLNVLQVDPPPPPHVHRDVQTIVMKCLEKEPERRYASPSELAEDLRRFLDGEPILARPPGIARRVSRWISRHGGTVAAAGALAIVAVLASVAIGEIRRARPVDLAPVAERARQAQRDRELEAAARYRTVRETLKPIEGLLRETRPYLYIEWVDIEKKLGAVRESIAPLEAMSKNSAYAGFPDVWSALGAAYYFVGDLVSAERALLRAEELDRDDPQVCFLLGRVYLELEMVSELQVLDREEQMRLSAEALKRFDRLEHREIAEIDALAAKAYHAMAAGEPERAVEICRDALKRHKPGTPGTEEFHLILSNTVLESAEKESEADAALNIRPHFPLALLLRASWIIITAPHGDRRLEEARKDLEEALRLVPGDFELENSLATCRFKMGDHAGAVSEFTRLIERKPSHAMVRYNRALVRIMNKEFGAAHEDLTEAIRLRPGLYEFHIARARVLDRMGKRDEAIADITTAIGLAPDRSSAYQYRGEFRMNAGEVDAAIGDFGRALERIALEPDAVLDKARRRFGALQLRGICRMRNRDARGALADFDAAIDLGIRTPEIFAYRATLRRDVGDLDGAVEDCTEWIDLEPMNPDSYSTRGQCRARKGDARGAIEDFDKAIELGTTVPDPYCMRGELRGQARDFVGAIRDFTKALEFGDSADVRTSRGLCRVLAKDPRGALEDFDAAIRLGSRSSRPYLYRGQLRRDSGDLDGAMEDFTKAITLEPSVPESWASRGDVHVRRKDYASARADYEKALQVAPRKWEHRAYLEKALQEMPK